jgi:hypothetical protein
LNGRSKGSGWTLIIGISDYAGLQKLDFCKNDARQVYKDLTKQKYDISYKNKLIGPKEKSSRMEWNIVMVGLTAISLYGTLTCKTKNHLRYLQKWPNGIKCAYTKL